MKNLFTYPNDSGTYFISSTHIGDGTFGVSYRTDEFLQGNYLAHAGLDPVVDLSQTWQTLTPEMSKYINYFDDNKLLTNLSQYDFYNLPLVKIETAVNTWTVDYAEHNANDFENAGRLARFNTTAEHALWDKIRLDISGLTGDGWTTLNTYTNELYGVRHAAEWFKLYYDANLTDPVSFYNLSSASITDGSLPDSAGKSYITVDQDNEFFQDQPVTIDNMDGLWNFFDKDDGTTTYYVNLISGDPNTIWLSEQSGGVDPVTFPLQEQFCPEFIYTHNDPTEAVMVQMGDGNNTLGFAPDRSLITDGEEFEIVSNTSSYTNLNDTFYVKKISDSEIPNNEGSNHAGENFELYTDAQLTNKFLISDLTWSTGAQGYHLGEMNTKNHDTIPHDNYLVTIPYDSGLSNDVHLNYHDRKIGVVTTMTTNGYDIWDMTAGDIRYLKYFSGGLTGSTRPAGDTTPYGNYEVYTDFDLNSGSRIQFSHIKQILNTSNNNSYYDLANIKDTDPANFSTTNFTIDASLHPYGHLFKEDDHFLMGKLLYNTVNTANDLGPIGWPFFETGTEGPELYINEEGSTGKWTIAESIGGTPKTIDDLFTDHYTYKVSWEDVANDRFNFTRRNLAMSNNIHNDMVFHHDKTLTGVTGSTDDFVGFNDKLYFEYISADDNYKLYSDASKTTQITWPAGWLESNQTIIGSKGPNDTYLPHTLKSRDGLDLLREPNFITKPAGDLTQFYNIVHVSGDANAIPVDEKLDISTTFRSEDFTADSDDEYDGDTLYQHDGDIDYSNFRVSVTLKTPDELWADNYYVQQEGLTPANFTFSEIPRELALHAPEGVDTCVSIVDANALLTAIGAEMNEGSPQNGGYQGTHTCYIPGHPDIRAFQLLDYVSIPNAERDPPSGIPRHVGVYIRFFTEDGNFGTFSSRHFTNFNDSNFSDAKYGNTVNQTMYSNGKRVVPTESGYLGYTNTNEISSAIDALDYMCASFKEKNGLHWPRNGDGSRDDIFGYDTFAIHEFDLDNRDMCAWFVPEKDMFTKRHYDGYYADGDDLIPVLRTGDSLPATTVDNPYHDNFANGLTFRADDTSYTFFGNNTGCHVRTAHADGGSSSTTYKFDFKYYDEATSSVITHSNIDGKFISFNGTNTTANNLLFGGWNPHIPHTKRVRADSTNTDGTYDFTSASMETEFALGLNFSNHDTNTPSTPSLYSDTVTFTRAPDRSFSDGTIPVSGVAENTYAKMIHYARIDTLDNGDEVLRFADLDVQGSPFGITAKLNLGLNASTTGDIEEVYSHASQFIVDEPTNFSGTATVTPHTNETHPRYIASHTIELGGDQQFRRLDANGAYENSIDWDNWYEPGDTDPETAKARPDVGLGAFEGTVNQTLDTNSRLNSITLGTMTQRGAYKATETEFVLNLYGENDLYVDPGAVDDGLQWQNFGNDDYKRWPNHIAPRAVSVNYNMPASSSTSPAGVKYSLPSGRYKWQIEVEYPPLTEDQFIEMQAVANAVSGTANPFWLYLKTNGNKWLFDTNISSTNKIRYRKEEIDNNTNTVIETGLKNFLVDGFEGSESNAFRAGDVIAAEDNINGSLNTVVNTVDANVFGEARITLASPLENDHFNGEIIDTDPERCVVTLADGDFIYTKNTNGFFSLTVTFNLDKFED